MRETPAQRHYARVMAAKAAATSEHGAVITNSTYELLLMQLAEDRRRLKDIQSVERKIEAKKLIVPSYQDWIIATLNEGKGAQDDVLMTLLVWHIDIGDFGLALQIAAYAIQHGLTLPDQYSRNVATMLLDEFSVSALTDKFDDPAVALQTLLSVAELTEKQDAHDQARAKLHKAIAYEILKHVDSIDEKELVPETLQPAQLAMEHLQRALELFQHVGVKKDIERLGYRINRATQPS